MTTGRESARDLGDRYRISSDTYEEKVEELEQENKMTALLDTVEISGRNNDVPIGQQQQKGGDSVDDPKEEDSSGKRVPESSPPVVVVIAPNDSNASNLETGEDDANTAPVDAKKERKKQGPKKDAAKAPEVAAEEATEDAAENQEGPKKMAATVENAAKKESEVVEDNLPDGGSSARANVPVEENAYAPAGKLNISQSQEEVMNTITAANQSAQVANRPLGLPIYAWGVIGVGLLLGLVLGALIAKKRRREKSASVGPTSTSRKSASVGPTSTSTKKRIAIDYGGDGSVDVEELSIVSDISSLSGGTFVVQQDRV